MIVSLLLAMDKNRGIGFENKLPWHLPRDMKFFKEKTTGHFMVMGRKTFDSLGKPLPNRTSIIITRQKEYQSGYENVVVVHSLEEALTYCASKKQEEVFIVGGGEIFKQTLEKKLANKIYLTEVYGDFEADVFFPEIRMEEWLLVSKEEFKADEKNKYDCSFLEYIRR